MERGEKLTISNNLFYKKPLPYNSEGAFFIESQPEIALSFAVEGYQPTSSNS